MRKERGQMEEGWRENEDRRGGIKIERGKVERSITKRGRKWEKGK